MATDPIRDPLTLAKVLEKANKATAGAGQTSDYRAMAEAALRALAPATLGAGTASEVGHDLVNTARILVQHWGGTTGLWAEELQRRIAHALATERAAAWERAAQDMRRTYHAFAYAICRELASDTNRSRWAENAFVLATETRKDLDRALIPAPERAQ